MVAPMVRYLLHCLVSHSHFALYRVKILKTSSFANRRLTEFFGADRMLHTERVQAKTSGVCLPLRTSLERMLTFSSITELSINEDKPKRFCRSCRSQSVDDKAGLRPRPPLHSHAFSRQVNPTETLAQNMSESCAGFADIALTTCLWHITWCSDRVRGKWWLLTPLVT